MIYVEMYGAALWRRTGDLLIPGSIPAPCTVILVDFYIFKEWLRNVMIICQCFETIHTFYYNINLQKMWLLILYLWGCYFSVFCCVFINNFMYDTSVILWYSEYIFVNNGVIYDVLILLSASLWSHLVFADFELFFWFSFSSRI